MKEVLSEILSILEKKSQEKKPLLTIRQKFALFMLPDKKLSKKLQTVKHNELKDLEKNFVNTDLLGLHKEMCKSREEISIAIKDLYELDFGQPNDTKQEKLDNLKTHLEGDPFNYSSDTIHKIRLIIRELCELHPAEYETHYKINEILKIRNTIKDESAIQIVAEFSAKEYAKTCIIEQTKKTLLTDIDNQLLTFEYALTTLMNNEIIFSLAYVDRDTLSTFAPKLSSIIRRRSLLYNRMLHALPTNLKPNVKEFHYMRQINSDHQSDDRNFIYYKLRSVITAFNNYFAPALGRDFQYTVFPIPPKLAYHLEEIISISEETDLLDIRTSNYTNLDFFLKMHDLTLDDIGNVLGITKQAVSQQNKLGPLKLSSTRLWDLYRIFNASIDFWQEKTTIPSYGKMYPKFDAPLSENDNDISIPYLKRRAHHIVTAEDLLSYFELQINQTDYLNKELYKKEKHIVILKIIGSLKQKIRSSKYSPEDLHLLSQLVERF